MIKILIVEDDPMVAKINNDYISRIPNFKVEKIINNGKDALEYLSINNGIDLIILDIYMPNMDGLELLEKIRSSHNYVDVIFVTAAKEKKAIQRGLQLGAVDYLIKPFTFERIQLALEKYKQRYSLFSNNENVAQEQLDQIFKISQEITLPKGIHTLTLKRIEFEVYNSKEDILDLQKISSKLSISLVTLRLYLDYLVDNSALIKQTQYGAVGRPTFIYIKK